MYFVIIISSTESDGNIYLVKAWTGTDWLLIIWKSDLPDKVKREWKLYKNGMSYFEQILVVTPTK